VADGLEQLPAPTPAELAVLRDLHARTESAHATPVHIKLPAAT
jgi:hypothetical protein